MRKRIVCLVMAVLAAGRVWGEPPAEIAVDLDPGKPEVTATNMLARSLFHACVKRPLHLGPRGVGTFAESARLTVPVEVTEAGRYRAVLVYALEREPDVRRREHHGPHIRGSARETRLVSLRLDGQSPASWRNQELWPTTPSYPWGSRHLYTAGTGLRRWTLSPEPMHLETGRRMLTLEVAGGPILFERLILTTGTTPENPERPQLMDHNVAFPALEFTGRTVETVGERLRMTFRGRLTNLAPLTVSYDVATAVLPRLDGRHLFRIVAVEPGERLDLEVGEEKAFALIVESEGPVPERYSQLIRFDLKLRDVEGLPPKPYLLAASNGTVAVNPEGQFMYTKGYHDGNHTVQDGTDMRHVVPTREHLGLKDGRYERNVTEAFVQALASAPPEVAVNTRGRWATDHELITDLAALAREGKTPPRFETWDRMFAAVIAGAGQRLDTTSLKDMMLRLAREYPYYPVSRWDDTRPSALPQIQWTGEDVYPMASYVKLQQERAVSDEEHVLFLHNVVLPYLVKDRDDWRIHGTLAEDATAGDTVVVLARETPPNIFPTEFVGSWIRIGEGDRIEYVRRASGGDARRFALNPNTPGPLAHDHPAGTPWASFHMWEDVGLEGMNVWTLMSIAVASADAAVIELCTEKLGILFATQNLYRADGSFAEEPGSYGFGGFNYVRMIESIEHFLGRDAARIPAELREKMFNALAMWNEFPFSDGMIPMLNEHGTVNQIPRQSAPFELMQRMFPDREAAIARFARIIEQEKNRTPGSMVDNRSFKIEGWGYALLRGPGSWDTRMEALLASKKGVFDPAHHMSRDCMSLWFYAHGALMTPRYGYHWINPPCAVMYNQVKINAIPNNYWGWFAHFDDHPAMPSAVAVTDMSGPWSHAPGFARQQRWVVQLPEYAVDLFEIRPRDGGQHRYAWGYRNLGELAVTSPAGTELEPIVNADGTPWDPIGYYRKNTGKEGLGFATDGMWQADWTLNEGNVTFPEDYPNPPRGARLRLTMASGGPTRVVTAYLRGPARNFQIRQDFVEVTRTGPDALFVATYEPIAVGAAAHVESVELLPDAAPDGARAVRVKTALGEDWFLAGGTGLETPPPVRRLGPFETDAALAVVRIVDGKPGHVMLRGGTTLRFDLDGVTVEQTGVKHEETRHVSDR